MGNHCATCDECESQERVISPAAALAEDMVLVQDQSINILRSARRMLHKDKVNAPEIDLPRLRLGQVIVPRLQLPNEEEKKTTQTTLAPDPEYAFFSEEPQDKYTIAKKQDDSDVAIISTRAHDGEDAVAIHTEVIFDSEDGRDHCVQIFKRPLGAEFSKRRDGPTKVTKVHSRSYAWRLGIEIGWSIKSVDGEDVQGNSFEQTQEALKSRLAMLPWQVD
jgi:hypothetical protein